MKKKIKLRSGSVKLITFILVYVFAVNYIPIPFGKTISYTFSQFELIRRSRDLLIKGYLKSIDISSEDIKRLKKRASEIFSYLEHFPSGNSELFETNVIDVIEPTDAISRERIEAFLWELSRVIGVNAVFSVYSESGFFKDFFTEINHWDGMGYTLAGYNFFEGKLKLPTKLGLLKEFLVRTLGVLGIDLMEKIKWDADLMHEAVYRISIRHDISDYVEIIQEVVPLSVLKEAISKYPEDFILFIARLQKIKFDEKITTEEFRSYLPCLLELFGKERVFDDFDIFLKIFGSWVPELKIVSSFNNILKELPPDELSKLKGQIRQAYLEKDIFKIVTYLNLIKERPYRLVPVMDRIKDKFDKSAVMEMAELFSIDSVIAVSNHPEFEKFLRWFRWNEELIEQDKRLRRVIKRIMETDVSVLVEPWLHLRYYFNEFIKRINSKGFFLSGQIINKADLISKGYKLEKLVEKSDLEIYRIFDKENKFKGYFWDGRFYDEAGLRERYRELVYRHACLDNFLEWYLGKPHPIKEVIKEVDRKRIKIHVTLYELGSILGINMETVDKEIEKARKQAFSTQEDKVYLKEANIYFLEDEADPAILGRKGSNLIKLRKLNLPLPSGFIITYGEVSDLVLEEGLSYIEEMSEKIFGPKDEPPLLLSIRSSPPVSMPGILDTVLNVGFTLNCVEFIEDVRISGTVSDLAMIYGEEFAWRTYLTFLKNYSTVVLKLDEKLFPEIPSEPDVRQLIDLAVEYHRIIEAQGKEIPSNPRKQLKEAIKAVFDSWNNEVAKLYRQMENIPDNWSISVVVQEMKFGNLNENSGSFVIFTRHPVTGEKGIYIEYAPKRQGVDLVSGSIDPTPIEKVHLPGEVIDTLKRYAEKIESEFGYVQDIEGVIEDGKIWILQTRDAKLSPEAKAKVLVEMVEEGLLTKEEALERVELEGLEAELTRPRIASEMDEEPIGKGLGASSGAVVGVVALSEEKIKEYKEQELPVILIKEAIYPASDWDVMGMIDGLVTHVGGILSHGAVQARIMGIPAVVGVDMKIEEGMIRIGDLEIKEGEYVTIDGTNGFVYYGKVPLTKPGGTNFYLEELKRWREERSI